MTEKNAWKFRPGSDENIVLEVLKTGCIRLDYKTTGLNSRMTIDELTEALRSGNPENLEMGLRMLARQIDTILSKVKKGDVALVPRERGKFMMIGEVVSDRPSIKGSALEVKVNWLDPKVPLARFDLDLRHSFKAIHKFCGVSRNGAVQRILKISEGEADPGY
ncbi:hypothetical protein [Shimia sp.]|uniref:hypothetical protein n=1 Tax=Shimia sp. TaxID=1954381 RepID=UPI0032989341